MSKFLAGAMAATMLVTATTLLADPRPKPKKADKLAAELCVAAMESGAYAGQPAAQLGDYCVELAVHLVNADYSTP
jgi:hypothetical protein